VSRRMTATTSATAPATARFRGRRTRLLATDLE
jgi:hypothetical protein